MTFISKMDPSLFSLVATILSTTDDDSGSKYVAEMTEIEKDILAGFMRDKVELDDVETEKNITQENVQKLLDFCEYWGYINIDRIILMVQKLVLFWELDLYDMKIPARILNLIRANPCVASTIDAPPAERGVPWTRKNGKTLHKTRPENCECAKYKCRDVKHLACFLCIKTWYPDLYSSRDGECRINSIAIDLKADISLIVVVLNMAAPHGGICANAIYRRLLESPKYDDDIHIIIEQVTGYISIGWMNRILALPAANQDIVKILSDICDDKNKQNIRFQKKPTSIMRRYSTYYVIDDDSELD